MIVGNQNLHLFQQLCFFRCLLEHSVKYQFQHTPPGQIESSDIPAEKGGVTLTLNCLKDIAVAAQVVSGQAVRLEC
jgi:hypothetical protein